MQAFQSHRRGELAYAQRISRIEAQIRVRIDDAGAVAREFRSEAETDQLAQRAFYDRPRGPQQESIVLRHRIVVEEEAAIALDQSADPHLVIAIGGLERNALFIDRDHRRHLGPGLLLFLLQFQLAFEDAQALVQAVQTGFGGDLLCVHQRISAYATLKGLETLLQLLHRQLVLRPRRRDKGTGQRARQPCGLGFGTVPFRSCPHGRFHE